MRPLLKDGEIIFVKETKKIFVGDIVLYHLNNKKYLHRVVKIEGDKLTVCDDVGITSETKISYSNVLGIYRTIFSGLIGFLYHKIVRFMYLNFRRIKQWFI